MVILGAPVGIVCQVFNRLISFNLFEDNEAQNLRSVAIFRETRNGVRPISGAKNQATAMAFGGSRSSCVRLGAHSARRLRPLAFLGSSVGLCRN